MWCIGCKSLSKKKIIILASITSVAAVILYYSFTINPVTTLAVLPFLLPLVGCIVMCGVIMGVMFLAGRFSKKSDKSNGSCCTSESIDMSETNTKPKIKTNNKKDNSSRFTR
jgi:hypothetical protein